MNWKVPVTRDARDAVAHARDTSGSLRFAPCAACRTGAFHFQIHCYSPPGLQIRQSVAVETRIHTVVRLLPGAGKRSVLRRFFIETPMFLHEVDDVRIDAGRFMFPACPGFFKTIEFSGFDIDGMSHEAVAGISQQFA